MKVPKACRQCRESKRKCVRGGPGEPCNTCYQRLVKCDGDLRIQRHGGSGPLPSFEDQRSFVRVSILHPTPFGSDLPQGLAIELVEHYLDKFHDRPHSLFHPATLRTQVREGTIAKALLYAICAPGAKFSINPDTRRLEGHLATESKRLLQADLENICLENIQTAFLIATLSVGNGNSSSEMLFFRIGVTMADILRLNSPQEAESAIERETRQRVWWSLYMADLWCISGLGLPSHMKDVLVLIERPMDESVFSCLEPGQRSLVAPWKAGLWSFMTTLVQLFGPIQDLNRQFVKGEVSEAEMYRKVSHVSQKLQKWLTMLPVDAQMNDEQLASQQKKGSGGLLISIHLAYHHFSTLLYFRFLENHQAPSSTDDVYIKRCKWHASQFSFLIRKSRQLKGCEAVYPLVGHMTTVSSSVLLHTLLFGSLDELDIARRELNANFEALIELKKYWPATSNWIDRLILFQTRCLLSTDAEAHRLDGWMLRLLIEHSLALDVERDSISEHAVLKARELAGAGRYMDFNQQPGLFS